MLTGVALVIASTAVKQCDKAGEGVTPCMYSAIVKDFAGLDGCGILLVLENGKKLLAVNLGDYQPCLKDGESVRISYEEAGDMMSICMTEDMMVNLTCLTRKSNNKWVEDCPVMVDPYRVKWAGQVMQEINPRQVEELIVEGHRMYRFYATSGSYIYSCSGELLCTSTYISRDACAEIEKKTQEVRIIYVVNE